MIKILNDSDIDSLKALLLNINTIMGQDLSEVIPWTGATRREILTEKLINDYLRWNSKSRNTIGWYDGTQLRSVLFQDFSVVQKSWSMSYYISDYRDYRALHSGTECARLAWSEAEKLNYYEYYRVIEASKIKTFERAWRDTIRSRYLMVVDEVVPAHEKPMTTHAWDWLFEGSSKTVDTAIVKGILLPKYRPN